MFLINDLTGKRVKMCFKYHDPDEIDNIKTYTNSNPTATLITREVEKGDSGVRLPIHITERVKAFPEAISHANW
jgi:hypothetical protein